MFFATGKNSLDFIAFCCLSPLLDVYERTLVVVEKELAMVPEAKFISIEQFMKRYGCSKGTVYNLHHAQQITIRKFGGASRISIEEADAWANSRPALPVSDKAA